MPELLTFLFPITAKWQEMGELLGAHSNIIEGLSISNKLDFVKMSEVLHSLVPRR